MSVTILNLVLLFCALLCILSLSWLLQTSRERRRRNAFAHPPLDLLVLDPADSTALSRAYLLVFSTPTCRQCRLLQRPVIQHIRDIRSQDVVIIEADSARQAQLTQHYQVTHFPTTIVLNGKGEFHAINYGFANAQCLLKQIDEVLPQKQASPQPDPS